MMAEAKDVTYPVTVHWREGGDGVSVKCSDELTRLLDKIASECDPDRPPLVMIGNEGGSLAIGVGAHVSTLDHVPPSGDPPYRICVGDPNAKDLIDFYYFGHHSQYLTRNAVPNEIARRAVLEFAESGQLSKNVTWEEV